MKRPFLEVVSYLPRWSWVFLRDHLGKMSAHTLGWVTILLMHFAPVPTMIAVLIGKIDRLPPVDIMIFLWVSLLALFFKSLIEKNRLYIATICLGFMAQTILMSLILFK
jgi:hypothetical protein